MFSNALLDEVIGKIVSMFRPEKIVIFGSVARGTAGPDSDIDMLIVMNTELSYYRRTAPIHVAMRNFPVAMDIFVLTPEEYDRLKDDEYSFASEIHKTGKVAYEA